jgi:low affinity Fe/Cu permease
MTPATTSRRDHRRGTLYMLLVIAMIWGGFLPVASRLLAVDPYWLTAMRFGTAALVFLGLLLVQEGAPRCAPKASCGRSPCSAPAASPASASACSKASS